ncbi:hypothetical protein ZHAS_00009977 [Anopheles sinensis]|uniref:Uncharacterized protein n=1 Tax=Anopheles sinensis TaxID=74873 RepID=A0A084VWE9_ANOSI|nr:hypothetical protein ZHAS_00009977 [Anopheles sinensis]
MPHSLPLHQNKLRRLITLGFPGGGSCLANHGRGTLFMLMLMLMTRTDGWKGLSVGVCVLYNEAQQGP